MESDRAIANLGPAASDEAQPPAKLPRKRFVGRRAGAQESSLRELGGVEHGGDSDTSGTLQTTKPVRLAKVLNQVPREILEDPSLQAAIAHLPSNYNFEIPKTVHRIRSAGSKNVALQFPEGLLLFAPLISDILTSFCPGVETLIMGDVTYGACCIDDYTARALGCDLLVHYGHSCLVPMDQTGGMKTLYVFVTIGIDADHLVRTIEANFQAGKKIALVGTIQFNATLHAIVPRLHSLGFEIILPRSSPLSAGEILGCTAPTVTSRSSSVKSKSPAALIDADLILYIGDGRFHLESILIASPTLREQSYRYDPYSRRLTHETYDHNEMHSLRRHAIQTARKTLEHARSRQYKAALNEPITWGIILGTLGRQGNSHTLSLITRHLTRLGIPFVSLLLSEIQPNKLALMSRDVGVWVQIACPRLSIDWGYAFERPLLSPYEAMVALGARDGDAWLLSADPQIQGTSVIRDDGGRDQAQTFEAIYPMDFYSKNGLGRTTLQDAAALTIEKQVD